LPCAWLLRDYLGLNVILPVLPMHGPSACGLPKGAVFPGDDVLGDVHATAQAAEYPTVVVLDLDARARVAGRAAAGRWPKCRIRAVRQAAGVAGNDVITAVVAGVLRCWLLDRGELPKRSLVAICPITVRGREGDMNDDRHGSMFGLGLCPLGTNLNDPAERWI
jgi:hypothetical protein